jgi:hypothetical protein
MSFVPVRPFEAAADKNLSPLGNRLKLKSKNVNALFYAKQFQSVRE